ncbi:TPA: hypothetical protein N0F65_003866 [Lagenidium giganteum]|uniref:Uncharacterized protein n=1 Tax=Lagenidium giganteum TaxID=4803 RepID=A0AAV2Z717_9STRA|nr:TPA: hypothetical protein N0F65_003866 [Lagenidium giganteum]
MISMHQPIDARTAQMEKIKSAFVPAGTAEEEHENQQLCLYPSTRCFQARARKRDGNLHLMCEYHRVKANRNQRRLEQRRRAIRVHAMVTGRPPPQQTLWNRAFPEPIPLRTNADNQGEESERVWQPDELDILWQYLFGDTDESLLEENPSRSRSSSDISIDQTFKPCSHLRSRAINVKEKRPGQAVTAAASLCALSDIYTRNSIEGKWRELIKVYDQRKNDDNLKEILDLSAPSARLNDLNVWHLERMAVGELEPEKGASASDLAMIHGESRAAKQVLKQVLTNAESFRARREQLVNAMIKQRDALMVELDTAKDFLEQIHRTAEVADNSVVELSGPVSVEQRLLSSVKPPESSESIDLSEVPSI